MVVAALLSEQPLRSYVLRVELVHQGIGVLRQRGSVNDDFKVLAHLHDEFLTAWPYLDEDVVRAPVDVDRQHYVCLVRRIKRRVNQRFIDVENQSFHTTELLRLRTQQRLIIQNLDLVCIWHALGVLLLLCHLLSRPLCHSYIFTSFHLSHDAAQTVQVSCDAVSLLFVVSVVRLEVFP